MGIVPIWLPNHGMNSDATLALRAKTGCAGYAGPLGLLLRGIKMYLKISLGILLLTSSLDATTSSIQQAPVESTATFLTLGGLEPNEAIIGGPGGCAFTNALKSDELERKNIDGNSYFLDLIRIDDDATPLWIRINNKLFEFDLVESKGDFRHIQDVYRHENFTVTLDVRLESELDGDGNITIDLYKGTVSVNDGQRTQSFEITGSCGP